MKAPARVRFTGCYQRVEKWGEYNRWGVEYGADERFGGYCEGSLFYGLEDMFKCITFEVDGRRIVLKYDWPKGWEKW